MKEVGLKIEEDADRTRWREGGDEVYSATFGNDEETGLKLNDDDESHTF